MDVILLVKTEVERRDAAGNARMFPAARPIGLVAHPRMPLDTNISDLADNLLAKLCTGLDLGMA